MWIKGLEAGSYELSLPKTGEVIQVVVHKGQYWETDSFILKKRCLLENRQAQKIFFVKKTEVSQQEGGKSEVKIHLENSGSETRVHAFAFNFLPKNWEALEEKFRGECVERSSQTEFPFAVWKNIFMSDR